MQDNDIPAAEELVVYHLLGESEGGSPGVSRYDTEYFHVDDASAVLIVETNDPDPRTRRPIAAFNGQYWVHADFEPVREEVDTDAAAADPVSP